MKLVVTKPFSYGTRRLMARDELIVGTDISPRDARLLLAIKKVQEVKERPASELPEPPAGLIERANAVRDLFDHDGDGRPGGSRQAEPSDDLPGLRRAYFQVVGKRPFNGWDADTLRERIAAARARPLP